LDDDLLLRRQLPYSHAGRLQDRGESAQLLGDRLQGLGQRRVPQVREQIVEQRILDFQIPLSWYRVVSALLQKDMAQELRRE